MKVITAERGEIHTFGEILSEQSVRPPGHARLGLDIPLDDARRMDFREKDGQPFPQCRDALSAFDAGLPLSAVVLCLEFDRAVFNRSDAAPTERSRRSPADRFTLAPTPAAAVQSWGGPMSEGPRQPPRPETAGDTAGSASFPLSQADRAILALEGPMIAGHICKVIRLGPPAPPLTTLIEAVAARLPLAPALTWKLAGPPEAPCWRPDPTFDLHAHIAQLACVVPLDDAALQREVARLFLQRLDRDRPLWRIDLVGPLTDGDMVLVWKVHHALADGATLMALARDVLWDPHPEAHTHGRRPHPDTPIGRHHHAGMIRRELLPGLHSSPFDAHIGHQRVVAFATTPLASLHDAAHSLAGATVNDAVLAVIAGALRRWLQHRHGALHDVRVKVPVSLHHEAQPQGNSDSYLCLPLPVGEPDPRKRLQAIRAATAMRKTQHDAQELDELLERLSQAAPGLQHWAQRLQTSPRTFALNVSNVPGPPRPVSVLGAPVRSMHPLAELAARHALRVAIVSVADTLCYGLLADPDVIADLDILATAIEEETTAILNSHD